MLTVMTSSLHNIKLKLNACFALLSELMGFAIQFSHSLPLKMAAHKQKCAEMCRNCLPMTSHAPLCISWRMNYDSRTEECKFAIWYLHNEVATVNLCNTATNIVWMKHWRVSVADCLTQILILLFGRCLFPRQLWVPLWGCSLQRYSRWCQSTRKRCAHNREWNTCVGVITLMVFSNVSTLALFLSFFDFRLSRGKAVW